MRSNAVPKPEAELTRMACGRGQSSEAESATLDITQLQMLLRACCA